MNATCKTCFFIGHRDAPDTIYSALLAEVERHITELEGVHCRALWQV